MYAIYIPKGKMIDWGTRWKWKNLPGKNQYCITQKFTKMTNVKCFTKIKLLKINIFIRVTFILLTSNTWYYLGISFWITSFCFFWLYLKKKTHFCLNLNGCTRYKKKYKFFYQDLDFCFVWVLLSEELLINLILCHSKFYCICKSICIHMIWIY